MSSHRSLRSRAPRASWPGNGSNISTRRTRQSHVAVTPSVTVSRSPPDSPEEAKRSIHLTVKMPSSKLREVTGGGSRAAAQTKRSVNVFTESPIVSGPRNSRSKKKIVEVDTSDEDDLEEEDDDDDDDDDVEDEDAPGDEDDDLDADGDLDMDDVPPRPPISKRQARSNVTSVPASRRAVKSVEAKEMELDDEDEEVEEDEDLSDLDSDGEGGADDQEQSILPDDLADAPGEDDELDEEDEIDEDEGIDSDEATPATGSRQSTPDYNRLTKRQRGTLGNDFLQLPMEPQVKKHLTAEERAMRRAEMARRRKNLSEKRNEEEKMDTINRLLRKQAPKRRGRVPAAEAAGDATPGDQELPEQEKADPTIVRWISNRDGCLVGVPEEWLGTPAGRVFGAAPAARTDRRLVEEV
ncbi:hypothetical protein ASPZODRAFT_132124 [Penicilliopsis zonata CBS 506.65]|uniref:INO80 complex subunit B-like conserved region domain-containing protein n=1 Tax=Penicilliopsis zonata CBS 506.65 TaxID=1073090 RepID=A0A1L9SIW4_9EURO|nr:hypothetical protein ASPZODRAFT_132124 [Penicilliopsis zonata CBS 506.65]OJJ47170.1 hypothetical protein ASPZODRAFT_132124 [Penicilliopsis zonata CBS 506.65]